jgi:molybdopterin converting factor subunit 1|tara:strand:+ start:710 stop:988 length:279 start_codon:yes stop_codon:yes gene_type:complete
MNWNSVLAEDNYTCRILFFASAAEALGLRETTISVDSGSTVADVVGHVAKTSPALALIQQTCAFAINETLVQADTVITDGCTIAVLPPVSGG